LLTVPIITVWTRSQIPAGLQLSDGRRIIAAMRQDRRTTTLPTVALSAGLLMLGLSAILVRLAAAPGIISAFYRVTIAVMVICPLYLFRRRGKTPLGRPALILAALGGIFFAGDLAAWSTGVMLSGATNPTLLANTAPLWVGLGARFIFQERLGRGFWFGLGLSMVGAAIVLGQDALRSFDLGFGTLLGLLAGIFYGSYFLVSQRARQRLDALSYFWLSSLVNSVLLLGLTGLLQEPLLGYSRSTYILLGLLALGPQVFGWLAINYAQGHLPASVVSPTLLGQPVVTAVLAGPMLGESLRPLQVVGGIAVLIGVFVVHRSRSRSPAAAEA
jgi:drug/metabolite transporter (DMT)-like permease